MEYRIMLLIPVDDEGARKNPAWLSGFQDEWLLGKKRILFEQFWSYVEIINIEPKHHFLQSRFSD